MPNDYSHITLLVDMDDTIENLVRGNVLRLPLVVLYPKTHLHIKAHRLHLYLKWERIFEHPNP